MEVEIFGAEDIMWIDDEEDSSESAEETEPIVS